MSSKSKRRKPEMSLSKAVTMAMVIFVWAWVSTFNPSKEDVRRLSDEVANIRDSVRTQRLNIWEVKQALKEEYDVEVVY